MDGLTRRIEALNWAVKGLLEKYRKTSNENSGFHDMVVLHGMMEEVMSESPFHAVAEAASELGIL